MSQGPLRGIRVIELAGLGPAPFAAMLLADLGADVVRIDRPGPALLLAGQEDHDLLNRGKRSVLLDLRHPDAAAAALTLVATADILLEGFRPGVAERLGLGPQDCLAVNPGLVYGRMTGWGQDGPLAHTAGHDVDYLALTGALHAIGPEDGPAIPLNLVGDFGGGSLYLVVGVLSALLAVRSGAPGQVVDAAIVDGTAHLLTAVHTLLGVGRWQDRRRANLLDGGTPFYAVYRTQDGRHVAVGAIEPQFFAELIRLLDLPVDPAQQWDRTGWPELRRLLADVFATRTQAEWTQVFDGTDACVSPVLGLTEAPDHPHLAARGTFVPGQTVQAAPAPRFSGTTTAAPSGPPRPGQHTRQVLTGAGLDADHLLRSGAARQAD